LAHTEILAYEKSTISTCFLIRAAGWFGRHGVKINLVTTDNGSGYRSRLFLTACHSLGAKPIKTKPYTPRTNGKAERFIQTNPRELAHRQAYESSAEREATLLPWLQGYNYRRPHAYLQLSYYFRIANGENLP
jgi:transposase InsO family protein